MFDVQAESRSELEAAVAEVAGVNSSYLLIGNKADVMGDEDAAVKFEGIDALYISAKTHHHVDVLKERLVDKVLQGQVNTESTIVTNARHHHALVQVASSIAEVRRGLENRIPGDLLALDIRRALHYLGEITGEITNDDQLDYIFSKFCIGK
jgi:tRNA modification GTPase